jgi:RHS repeat-associated protein
LSNDQGHGCPDAEAAHDARNASADARYFLTDQVDSVKVVLNDSGLAVTRTEYLPFGETWFQEGDSKNAPKYNSQELDKESGYYFYNARHYDPEIARFVTPDTVIPYQTSTQSWNRFSYCRNNPIIYRDPTGHFDVEIPLVKEAGHEVLAQRTLDELGMGSDSKNFIAGARDNDVDDKTLKQAALLTASPDLASKAAAAGILGDMLLKKHNSPDAQSDHAMKPSGSQNLAQSVQGITDRIQSYADKAMKARNDKDTKAEEFYLGKALHVIQDSFAKDHVKRDKDNKITDVYDFNDPSQKGKHKENDNIWEKDDKGLKTGNIKAEARDSVKAGVSFLRGYYEAMSYSEKYNVREDRNLLQNYEIK